jgi:hypothetical protein
MGAGRRGAAGNRWRRKEEEFHCPVEFAVQPGLRKFPIQLHGIRRDSQNSGGLLNG